MKNSSRSIHLTIWSETILVILIYTVAIWLCYGFLMPRTGHSWLALALGFCLVQCVVVITLLLWLMARKQWFLMLRARSEQHGPAIQEELARVAMAAEQPSGVTGRSGLQSFDEGIQVNTDVRAIRDRLNSAQLEDSELTELRRLQATYPREFEATFVEFLPAMTGVGRDRLSQVAARLGLVEKWKRALSTREVKKRRTAVARITQLSGGTASNILLGALQDPDVLIRTEAARGLVSGGSRREREQLFTFLSDQPLLVRALLTNELSSYADELSQQAIPEALASRNEQLILVTLQVVESWGRVLHLEKFQGLLRHNSVAVRVQASRTLPLVRGLEAPEKLLMWGLGDPEPRVRAAAASAAGKMKLPVLLEPLSEALRDDHIDVTLAAAFALANMAPEGARILERAVVEAPPRAASAALEAIEKLQVGRLDFESLNPIA